MLPMKGVVPGQPDVSVESANICIQRGSIALQNLWCPCYEAVGLAEATSLSADLLSVRGAACLAFMPFLARC